MIPYTETRRPSTTKHPVGSIAGTPDKSTNWMIAAETAVHRLGKMVADRYKTLKMNG